MMQKDSVTWNSHLFCLDNNKEVLQNHSEMPCGSAQEDNQRQEGPVQFSDNLDETIWRECAHRNHHNTWNVADNDEQTLLSSWIALAPLELSVTLKPRSNRAFWSFTPWKHLTHPVELQTETSSILIFSCQKSDVTSEAKVTLWLSCSGLLKCTFTKEGLI